MPFPNPPSKIVAFNSGAVAPHDIGRQFDEHRRGVGEVINFLRTVVREDGRVANGSVGFEQLDPALPAQLAQAAVDAMSALLISIRTRASEAQLAASQVEVAKREIEVARRDIAASARALAEAREEVHRRLSTLDLEIEARVAAALPTGVLGPNAGGFYGVDTGAGPLAQDYAQVSIEWAEHMPDTIPPNILAVNAITGEHWSSRWWANRAAGAFGMLAWWYMGAWPSPGPPSTPNTPTGQPIPPGSMYFNTDTGAMYVWNGSTWVNAYAPGAATTASLYYLAAAGQTAFPCNVNDRNGHTFAFNQTVAEGALAHVNGVRLEPTFDYTVDTVNSVITFLRPLTLNSLVILDFLTPVGQLTPSGTVNTVLLKPIVPDGTTTSFALAVAMNNHPTNIAKNEELLVSLNGVIQQPALSYNASGSNIVFTQAPEADAAVYIVWFGPPNP